MKQYPYLAYITGIDLTEPISSESADIINDTLSKHCIILFKQQLTKATQLADLAKIFSPKLQLYGDNQDNEIQMYIVQNRTQVMRGSDFWHSDLSYHPIPAFTTLLYGMEIPHDKSHGNTQFINMNDAYNRLPDNLKAYYSKLKGVHNISHNNGFPIDKYESNETPTPKDAIHPLIRIHPINGNKILYANPAYTYKIVDENNKDLTNSDEILEEIFDHAISAKYVIEHEWNTGDLLIWDNISLLHRATTIDMKPDLKRVMLRCCAICKEPPISA